MATPYNVIDAQRIHRLLDIIDEYPDKTELKIYIQPTTVNVGPYMGEPRYEKDYTEAYISVEVIARGVPMDEVKRIMALPIEELGHEIKK